MQRLTAADLSRFHRQHYVAGNLAVLAVGCIWAGRQLRAAELTPVAESSETTPTS